MKKKRNYANNLNFRTITLELKMSDAHVEIKKRKTITLKENIC